MAIRALLDAWQRAPHSSPTPGGFESCLSPPIAVFSPLRHLVPASCSRRNWRRHAGRPGPGAQSCGQQYRKPARGQHAEHHSPSHGHSHACELTRRGHGPAGDRDDRDQQHHPRRRPADDDNTDGAARGAFLQQWRVLIAGTQLHQNVACPQGAKRDLGGNRQRP
jgi:hypothetical protein